MKAPKLANLKLLQTAWLPDLAHRNYQYVFEFKKTDTLIPCFQFFALL